MLSFTDLLSIFNFIVTFLLNKTFNRLQSLKNHSKFDDRNNSQVFNAIPLSIAFGHRQIFAVSLEKIQKLENLPEKLILKKVLSLFGANLIATRYLSTLYEGNFMPSDIKAGSLLESGTLEFLNELKNEAVALVDSISPPDFIINSPLGMSDGNVYKHLQNYIYQTPDTFTRPHWWKEILNQENLSAKI